MSVYFPEFDDDKPTPGAWWLAGIVLGIVMLAVFASKARGAEVRSYRVVDGDTLEATVRIEFGYVLPAQIYRVYGFDAWESRRIRKSLKLTPAQWNVEVVKGRAAKAALESLLKSASVIELREVKALRGDPYGRELVELYADGKEVGAIMRSQGHERH